jgi:hypothetical protein
MAAVASCTDWRRQGRGEDEAGRIRTDRVNQIAGTSKTSGARQKSRAAVLTWKNSKDFPIAAALYKPGNAHLSGQW